MLLCLSTRFARGRLTLAALSLLIALVCTAARASEAHPAAIRIAIGEWPPYTSEKLNGHGIAGLDAAERDQLAREVVETQLRALGLKADDAVVEVRAEPGRFRLEVAYDAGGHPLMALSPLTVPPPRTIRRAAVIRVEES